MLQTGLFINEQHQIKNDRVENDYYPTPEGITRSLISHCPQLPYVCFEPCAGQGAITSVLRASGRHVYESDITYDNSYPKDATTEEFWKYRNAFDLCFSNNWATITNPPFNRAAEILPLAHKHSPWGVAFLLRLSYLEPADNRADWLQEHADQMCYLIPVNPRPKFRRDTKGSDSSTVAWMVWQKSWSWRQMGIVCPFIFENKWKKC